MTTLTHWKKLTNVNYLGAYSLDPGKDMVLTIKSVVKEMITGTDGKKEEAMLIQFMEPGVKPMICNKTNAKMIAKIHKTHFIEQWVGKKIALYASNVNAFGTTTEALRVRDFVPQESVDTTQAIKKLNACKSVEEVKAAYFALSKAEQSEKVVLDLIEKLKAELNKEVVK